MGFVLIAVNDAGICALDTEASVYELMETLQYQHPESILSLSDWDGRLDIDRPSNFPRASFFAVMEALVNPSGKMLDVPLNVGQLGHSTLPI